MKRHNKYLKRIVAKTIFSILVTLSCIGVLYWININSMGQGATTMALVLSAISIIIMFLKIWDGELG